MIPLFTTRVELDCYTNNFPGLPCLKKLAADKHVITELPLVPFVIGHLNIQLESEAVRTKTIETHGN